MKSSMMILLVGALFTGCGESSNPQSQSGVSSPAVASSSASTSSVSPITAPDNSGVNVRDRASDAVTAGSQGQNKSDVAIAADIRKRVMDAKMSVDAENSKIIATNGKVTLRGPVKDQDEKDQIGKIAVDEVGAANVDNQLEPKTNPTTNPSGM